MEKVIVSVEVPKEFHELGDALVGVVESSKKHLADGFQVSDPLAIGTENMSKIMSAVNGAEKIPAEMQEDPGLFAEASALLGGKILRALMAKQAAPVAPPAV